MHEIGHFFGLYHTFQGGCHDVWDLEAGDAVFDTPPQAHESHGSCPELAAESPDTCTLPGHSDQTVAPYFGADPYWNFMDYAHDNCMSEFTPGQASRLREVISQYKPTLCASMPGQSCEGVEGNVQAFSGSPGGDSTATSPPSLTPPSSIQCANPDFVSWSLTLQADNWPMEIGWRLTKKYELVDSFLVAVPEEEAAVAEVNFGDLMEPGGSWTWRRCLGPGVYTLRIRDSWGDGMCCFFGSGAWSTSLDGITVMNGDGDHGDGVDIELRANVPGGAVVGPEPPPPEPPPPPTSPPAAASSPAAGPTTTISTTTATSAARRALLPDSRWVLVRVKLFLSTWVLVAPVINHQKGSQRLGRLHLPDYHHRRTATPDHRPAFPPLHPPASPTRRRFRRRRRRHPVRRLPSWVPWLSSPQPSSAWARQPPWAAWRRGEPSAWRRPPPRQPGGA